MNGRIKEIRKSLGLTQAEFGARLSISQNYIAIIEGGQREPGDRVIRDICREFGVSEAWLRTGVGEMMSPRSREEEMMEAVGRLMASAPESFKAALVAALLRFDPNGKEWDALEAIYNSVAEEAEKGLDQ